MKTGFFIILGLIFTACSSTEKKVKTKKELELKQKKALKIARPVLDSDEFHYMGCKDLGEVEIKKDKIYNADFWKGFGIMDIRFKALELGANIMSLKQYEFGGVDKYTAKLYKCEKVTIATQVDKTGMCNSTEQKLFFINISLEDFSRKIGEEIVRTRIRYYAIQEHYKTYSIEEIKYSYTKKQYMAKASFYKCL